MLSTLRGAPQTITWALTILSINGSGCHHRRGCGSNGGSGRTQWVCMYVSHVGLGLSCSPVTAASFGCWSRGNQEPAKARFAIPLVPQLCVAAP